MVILQPMRKHQFNRDFSFLFLLILFISASHLQAQNRTRTVQRGKPAPKISNTIQQKFSVYFDVNQSKIKPEDYLVLDSVVSVLQNPVNIRRIQINGYADTTGGAEANLALSERRTDTVANYIIGKGLSQYKSKVSTASLGEKITGKEADLNEMRRVDIVLVLARPDRDTLIRTGCVTALIRANTFDGFNNDEVTFALEYTGTGEDATKSKITFKDEDGNNMLSNGVVKLVATYRGKPLKAIQPVLITLPMINGESGYEVYKGIEDKSKNISWKSTGVPVASGGEFRPGTDECFPQSFETKDLNTTLSVQKKWPSCYCASDPFGGVQVPDKSNPLAKPGKDGSIVLLNSGCFKKMDASTAWFQLEDGLYPDEFLNFCNGFLLPGVGDIPAIPKYDRELVKFIDFNVSSKNDSADMIMVKKNKVLIMIPKSKFPAHEGKQYAILFAETKKDDYFSWTNKIVLNNACLGLSNCDYWVFEVPFTGFYALLEVTPLARGSKKDRMKEEEDDDEQEEVTGKKVKVKTKKFNNVLLVYGLKDENRTQSAVFIKNKGKNSINEPAISKKKKKEYASHVFMAYVVQNGKRYAWIGTGKQMKKNIFTGNWKTPKLTYVPDEEWEAFVRKACE